MACQPSTHTAHRFTVSVPAREPSPGATEIPHSVRWRSTAGNITPPARPFVCLPTPVMKRSRCCRPRCSLILRSTIYACMRRERMRRPPRNASAQAREATLRYAPRAPPLLGARAGQSPQRRLASATARLERTRMQTTEKYANSNARAVHSPHIRRSSRKTCGPPRPGSARASAAGAGARARGRVNVRKQAHARARGWTARRTRTSRISRPRAALAAASGPFPDACAAFALAKKLRISSRAVSAHCRRTPNMYSARARPPTQ